MFNVALLHSAIFPVPLRLYLWFDTLLSVLVGKINSATSCCLPHMFHTEKTDEFC